MAQCNRIAKALESALKRNGYETKRAPEGQDMNKSITESNAWGADIHIPCHTNAGGGHGALVMVYGLVDRNLKYAKPVYDELQSMNPFGGGYGVKRDVDVCGYSLAEVRNVSAITVYCECAFHDNAQEAQWIIDNADKIGEAICKGICKGDGKNYIPSAALTQDVFYRVQVGAFTRKAYADKLLADLKKEGHSDAYIVEVKK